jgi:hypothetical protein
MTDIFRFLLAVFQTDYTCQQTTAKEMLQAARSMPTDPAAVYSRTMHQINSQPTNQARLANRILNWLTFAQEALTPRELVEALAVEESATELDPLNRSSPTMLARVCRGLVFVDESNDIVQLAHRTVQDYLLDLRDLEPPEGPLIQLDISATCLTYLSLDVFRNGPCSTPDSYRYRSDRYVFQYYAAWYLGRHLVLSGDESKSLLEKLYEFVTCKPLAESYLQAQHLHHRHKHFLYHVDKMTELHVAVLIGFNLSSSWS